MGRYSNEDLLPFVVTSQFLNCLRSIVVSSGVGVLLCGSMALAHSFPSRDFSPNLKQDLSGLSGFFRQLRSKSCFKMSGLSGF